MLNRVLLTQLLIIVLACTLASCGSTPPKSSSDRRSATAESSGPSARQLLSQARISASPMREQLTLQAAERLISDGDINSARNLLIALDSDTLNDELFLTHSEMTARLALRDGSYLLAHGILTAPRLERQWTQMDPTVEIRLRELRAQAFMRLGDVPMSIQERLTLSALLTDGAAAHDNQTELWHSLTSLSQQELLTRSNDETNPVLRGWYSLALLQKDSQADLERQQAQLESWRAQWPDHPANQNLPEDLQLLQTLIANQPRQIALLLPLQGRMAKAGEAVRDGFFAAYYQALYEYNRAPVIRQYDTSEDALRAYEQAVADGADLIIGPLDKEKVTELSLLPDLPVPLLTLNYVDTMLPGEQQKIVQFGLAVEDEARQVARQAYLEGHRYALAIVPSQEWSERSARAFKEEWESLGGVLVNTSQFVGSGDYSSVIKNAMLVEESNVRAQELQKLFGARVHHQTRRRQDVDMIFLIADPVQARQIKPMLAFHYAGSLPVYATSQVYSGVRDEKADRDLNGVRFNTAPWLFDNTSREKQAITQHARSSTLYSRLHALGVDAYRLYPRLQQLAQVPEMRLYGATGALRLLPNGRIEREQIWARFRNGVAQPLPMVATQLPAE